MNTIGRNYVLNQNSNKHALMITITKSGKSDSCSCFIIDLLMQQHKFCCVLNINDRNETEWQHLMLIFSHTSGSKLRREDLSYVVEGLGRWHHKRTLYSRRPLKGTGVSIYLSGGFRPTSHTRPRAHDQYTSNTLIGGKGGAGPSSLEGPTEYVNARWMYIDSCMALNGSCFMVTWTAFKNHLLKVDHGTPKTHNCLYIPFYNVWGPARIEIN
jgi:hypothetical protein